MTRSPIDKYRMGMITDDHLVVETLQMIDSQDPGPILSTLPEHIVRRMAELTSQYLHGRMETNYGALPTRGQVIAASHWIEQSFHPRASTTA